MYHFSIFHKSGESTDYFDINRVEYSVAGMEQVVEGSDIGKHKFPTTSNLYLFSDDCTCSINGDDISTSIVEKEND